MLGFCGGGGTPLFAGTEASPEATLDVAWFPPQSEYRTTEYLQQWCRFWFDDALRLQAAKLFQHMRLQRLQQHWSTFKPLQAQGLRARQCAMLQLPKAPPRNYIAKPYHSTYRRLSKQLYRLTLAPRNMATSPAPNAEKQRCRQPISRSRQLSGLWAGGKVLAGYWVLPHGFSRFYGKTRRGGLVFDVADLIKDAAILPQAFCSAMQGHSEQQFRQACIEALTPAAKPSIS